MSTPRDLAEERERDPTNLSVTPLLATSSSLSQSPAHSNDPGATPSLLLRYLHRSVTVPIAVPPLFLHLFLYAFILFAPYLITAVLNVYYLHVLSINRDPVVVSEVAMDIEFRTATTAGPGGVNASLRSFAPAEAAVRHQAGCGLTPGLYPQGLCYSLRNASNGGYEDCAQLIDVAELRTTDVHDAPEGEVNLYSDICRPLPAGHPDFRVYDPYTVRCDLPARVTASASLPLPSAFPSGGIPRHVHQTHARATFLPPMQFWAMRGWWDANPTWTYSFYDDAAMERFISSYDHDLFSEQDTRDVRTAYAAMREARMPMAAVADLFRYLLVYKLGGVYVDTDTSCAVPLEQWLDVQHDAFVIQDSWDLQWIIVASRNHPILRSAIRATLDNVLRHSPTSLAIASVYETTGPPVLNAAIRAYNGSLSLTPSHPPVRVVPASPPDGAAGVVRYNLHGRSFNAFNFAGAVNLKTCEMEYEQRLHGHVPWWWRQQTAKAAFFQRRVGWWLLMTWGSAGVAALVGGWKAARGEWAWVQSNGCCARVADLWGSATHCRPVAGT